MLEPLEKEMRFEQLTGRFFDGVLSTSEDEEFVALLEANPVFARRFVDQVRTENGVAGLTAAERLGETAFHQAISRSVELLENEGESERFAREIVKLVRDGAAGRSGRLVSLRTRRRVEQQRTLPLTIGFAAAAMLVLALLLAFSRPDNPTPLVKFDPLKTESVDLALAKTVEAPENFEEERPISTPLADLTVPSTLVKLETPAFAPPPEDIVEREIIPPVEREAPAVAKRIETPRIVPSIVPQKVEVASPEPPRAALLALGTLAKITNVKPILTHAAAKKGDAIRIGDAFVEGDMLRVTSPDLSAAELPPGPRGVDVRLSDGSMLWLKEGSVLVFHAEGTAQRPMLESGELLARVTPQQAESNLIVRTKQGPEASVLGTVFRVIADPAAKKVEVRVNEGKVQFSNKGEKRIIGPDEASVAEDGRAPTAVFYFRARLATLTGTVTDKDTGKPVEGADVAVIPYAQRAKNKRPNFGTKTDAQGKFTIRGLYEGPVFVISKIDDPTAASSSLMKQRGMVSRTRLNGGETTSLNLSLDRGSVTFGKVESGGKLLTDYSLRFIPASVTDGRGLELKLNVIKSATVDYASAVWEGPGRYVAAVEKPGYVSRIKNPKQYDLRPDRFATWPIEVLLSPSAALKGRVVNAGGVALADNPDMAPDDPRQPRSIATLTSGSGSVQMLEADPDGSFTFETNLESGGYELKIERFGYAPFIKRMNLIAGQTIEISATMEPAKPR